MHREEEPTWSGVLFPEHRAMQRILIIAVLLGICQQISGTEGEDMPDLAVMIICLPTLPLSCVSSQESKNMLM